MKNTILLFGLLFIFFACTEKGDSDERDLFTVSGIISQNGEPSENVKVSINEAFNYTVLTNEKGEFFINDVQKGKHELNIYKSSSSNSSSDIDSFISKSITLDVNNDITLNNLVLPKPIILNIVGNDSQLTWEATDAEDFREYKVFRHTSSGIDETTGELIHVSTTKTDTSVNINTIGLAPGTYFYRVYVMNDLGRLGGSNIVQHEVGATILKITVNYTGAHTVSPTSPIYIGYATSHFHDIDDGKINENNGSLEFHVAGFGQAGTQSTYGPYYISALMDFSGNHSQGSNNYPNDSPFIVYDGIDPLIAKEQQNATPIYVTRGTTNEIIVSFDDTYLTNNYDPSN